MSWSRCFCVGLGADAGAGWCFPKCFAVSEASVAPSLTPRVQLHPSDVTSFAYDFVDSATLNLPPQHTAVSKLELETTDSFFIFIYFYLL